LSFSGGQDGRQTHIDFQCDLTIDGPGEFMPALTVEEPTFDYHLIYKTAFACPINGPSTLFQCCSYSSPSSRTHQRGLCSLASKACPPSIGEFSNTGSVNTTNCESCAIGPIDRTCCVYTDSDQPPSFTTECVSNRDCNTFLYDNEKVYKTLANFPVFDCQDCFF
jgi:hypothetical protein